MATFGQRLKELRLENNLSQDNLADVLKVTKSAISLYEKDLREPAYQSLITLCDYFFVTADYLLGRVSKNGVCIDNPIEEEIVRRFRVADRFDQTTVLRTLRIEEKSGQAEVSSVS